jgi:DNA invertase Pin-like site-specific DNA recombinase
MADVQTLAAAASGADPTAGLRAALALRRLADSLEQVQVRNARRLGWSWQEIATALEVSRQAVHKKYAKEL